MSKTPLTDKHEAQRDAMDTRSWADYQSTLEFARELESSIQCIMTSVETWRACATKWQELYTKTARERQELRDKVMQLETKSK